MHFNSFSIRVKLIVLLGASAAIALLISALMSLSLTFVAQRSESLRHLQQVSDIARENLTAALAFRDNGSATRMLGSLSANPRILAAVIVDEEAKTFSHYLASGVEASLVAQHLAEIAALTADAQALPPERQQRLEMIRFDYLFAVTPIIFEGKAIGRLTLVSDTQALKQGVRQLILTQLLISALTLVIIMLISIRLQKVFTAPIFNLIEVIRSIAQTKNYAVSVYAFQNDEFKVLYQHFNDMITEIRQRDEQLSRQATTDPLTGLANRRHAMEVMQTMVTRAQRKHEPFGLVMFDVDHFKQINDRYGHPVGDVVLQQVAGILLRMARPYDLVARVGGEEFLVLCDHSDAETSRQIAERMRQTIQDTPVGYAEGKTLSLTASAGVYAAIPDSEDVSAALQHVDSALYHAKESGRNRVFVWEMT